MLATLHTNAAVGALPRLTNMGIDPFLSASVSAAWSPRGWSGGCARGARQGTGQREQDRAPSHRVPFRHLGRGADFYRPVGCAGCHGDGYHGRIGVFELMAMNDELEALALSRSSAAEIERAAVKGGMVRMRADGLLKAARSVTTVEEILRTTV